MCALVTFPLEAVVDLGDLHVFLPAGITGLFSLGALGVCL